MTFYVKLKNFPCLFFESMRQHQNCNMTAFIQYLQLDTCSLQPITFTTLLKPKKRYFFICSIRFHTHQLQSEDQYWFDVNIMISLLKEIQNRGNYFTFSRRGINLCLQVKKKFTPAIETCPLGSKHDVELFIEAEIASPCGGVKNLGSVDCDHFPCGVFAI